MDFPSDSTHRPNEPTQYGYTEYHDYMQTPIPPPPPPPKRSHKTTLFIIVFLIIALLVLGSALLFNLADKHQQVTSHITTTPTMTLIPTSTSAPAVVPTSLPTPMPTQLPTPVPTSAPTSLTVKYYASDIYNDFVANGLGGTNPKTDTKWSCCSYIPSGGAIVWTDSMTGYTMDIATFATANAVQIDEGQLNNKGFYTNVVHNCLLSYESVIPQSVINSYLQVMQIYCNLLA